MAVTQVLDESTPTDSTLLSQADDEIRATRKGVRERMTNGGKKWTDASLNADDGKTMCGVQGTTGVVELWYDEDGTLAGEYRDDTAAGNASRFQIGDGIDGSEPRTFVADTLQGKRSIPISVALTGEAGRQNGLQFVNMGTQDITLAAVFATCVTAPLGGGCDIDIHLVAASAGLPDAADAAGVSIVAAPPTISIPVGTKRAAAKITSFNDATLSPNESWVFEIDALNSAADIVLHLLITRRE